MAYDPRLYFPQGYQPYPMYQPQQPQIQQQQTEAKYVEAIPVDTEKEALDCPMAAGTTKLFFAKNDSFIAVKSAGVNGQVNFDVYEKRPPAPPAPAFDPASYVTRKEFDALVAQFSAAHSEKKEADDGTV